MKDVQIKSIKEVCARHGAKKKLCMHEGCNNQARQGGQCIGMGQHTKKRCSSEGCTNFARKRGVCMKHGANILDVAEI